jgi:signal-transduction protein with cAMP-binding, CBS, and nucleotidyltransferase domain
MSLVQTALEAKRYGVFAIEYYVTLAQATQRMVEEDVSALVVTDKEGYLVGILSRIDLIRAAIQHQDWADRRVEEFMQVNVVTVPIQATLRDVAEILLDRRIHRVVVVREEDGKQQPLSIISAADLVYHLAKDI